jgi:hypothetical protein
MKDSVLWRFWGVFFLARGKNVTLQNAGNSRDAIVTICTNNPRTYSRGQTKSTKIFDCSSISHNTIYGPFYHWATIIGTIWVVFHKPISLKSGYRKMYAQIFGQPLKKSEKSRKIAQSTAFPKQNWNFSTRSLSRKIPPILWEIHQSHVSSVRNRCFHSSIDVSDPVNSAHALLRWINNLTNNFGSLVQCWVYRYPTQSYVWLTYLYKTFPSSLETLEFTQHSHNIWQKFTLKIWPTQQLVGNFSEVCF